MKTGIETNGSSTEANEGNEVRFSCVCGQAMVAPVEMMGQLVDCPSCGRPVLVSRPVVLEPPKVKKSEYVPPMPGKAYAVHGDVREDYQKTRDSAHGVMTASAVLCVLGVVCFFVPATDHKMEWIGIASGLFSLGLVLVIVGQLMHIRSGIEETNFLKRKETREREVLRATERLRKEL